MQSSTGSKPAASCSHGFPAGTAELLPRVDPRTRIRFYVERGLVPRAPSDAQLRLAESRNSRAAGVTERIRWYVRNPLDLLPTESKKRLLRQPNEELMRIGHGRSEPDREAPPRRADPAAAPPASAEGTHDRLDRGLRALFLVSPLRFAAQCVYNPYYALPGSGLDIPGRFLIDHVLHAPHPSALWDLQVIHADPGGLDAFVEKLDEYARSDTWKARTFRALAQREGYYDYLRELAGRVRRFDYPPTPPGRRPHFENLVLYLNFAAEL